MIGARTIVAGLSLAVMLIGGCLPRAVSGGPSEVQPDRRVFHRKAGFSIIPPEGYRDHGPTFWHVMNFLGPDAGNFTVHFNVWVHVDKGHDIEQAGPLLRKAATTYLPKYRMQEEGFRGLPPGLSYFAHGTYTWEGRDLACVIYCIRGNNGYVYAVTFSAPVEAFDTHRPDFESAIGTVRTTAANSNSQ